jgi:hypothetical protein
MHYRMSELRNIGRTNRLSVSKKSSDARNFPAEVARLGLGAPGSAKRCPYRHG